jgi:hypothetical protein
MLGHMGRVTNRVDPASLADLVAAPARATLAWVAAGRLELAPVRHARDRGRHFVATPEGEPLALAGARASLVLDDGFAWFALRAVTLRGALAPCADPPAPPGAWLEFVPERVTAWDYGRLHEVPDS